MIIWYLFLIAPGSYTSQLMPEPSREVCMQQAEEYNRWVYRMHYDQPHAYCIAGSSK